MSNLGFSAQIGPGKGQPAEVGGGPFLGHGGLAVKIGPKSYRPKFENFDFLTFSLVLP